MGHALRSFFVRVEHVETNIYAREIIDIIMYMKEKDSDIPFSMSLLTIFH